MRTVRAAVKAGEVVVAMRTVRAAVKAGEVVVAMRAADVVGDVGRAAHGWRLRIREAA